MITSEDDEDGLTYILIHLRQFSKRSFDVSKMIHVQFIGKEAVDEGAHKEIV